MAKRKKQVSTSAPSSPRVGKPIHVWAPEELHEALEAYMKSLRPKPTITSVVCVALEDLLRKHGFWTQEC